VSEQDISAPASGVSDSARWRQLWVPLAVGLVLAVVLTFASARGWLPEAPDRFTYDWRTALLAERASEARDDIAIVLIDEDSLTGYASLSPIDRGLTAELIRAIDSANPKAIGLDYIIDRPTEPAKDAAFLAAVRDAKAPVILGYLDERGGPRPKEAEYQARFLEQSKRQGGHIFFATEKNRLTLGDQAVRSMVAPSPNPPHRPAFARLLAEVDGPKPEPASDLIHWQLPPGRGGQDLFLTFSVPAHRDDSGKPTGPVFPDSWRAALTGKIVLIGGGFSDRDRHLTPLAVANPERIHGVKIHAQILAQLRDGRSLHRMPVWLEFALVTLVGAFGFYAARRWTIKGDNWRTSMVALAVTVAVGMFLFWAFGVILPSSTLFLGWALGLLAGNRANWAMRHMGRAFGRRAVKGG
jgi:CHASE2 domain-containing sensor protein